MSTQDFFRESKEQSTIKAEIVAKYFWSWAKIIGPRAAKFAYIDLFAGPGRYETGSKSTPVLILERAVTEPLMRDKLVTIFNDLNTNNSKALQTHIDGLVGIDRLRYKPKVFNEEVGTQIVERLESAKIIPALMFIDPWGYKGLSLRLINSVLRNWGCECIFFFNYNRINMGLTNPAVVDHMNALFGEERADALRQRLQGMPPPEREYVIVNELGLALEDMGGKHVLPFRFKTDSGHRTSHHLIFVTKHPLGYGIMKEVMADSSSSSQQGVPSFEYNPVDNRQLRLLYDYARPLDDLEGMLLQSFKGRTLMMKHVYEQHHMGRPYVERNYKYVLLKLESEGKIITDPPADKRQRRGGLLTFGDNVRITFP